MASTLFDIAYGVHEELGQLVVGIATGGTTTTLVDTNDRTDKDADYWNGGTFYLNYDAAGEGAAPQGEYSHINDDDGAGTITLRTTLAAAPGAGDWYALAKKRYGLYRVVQEINAALREYGPIDTWDTTSMDTASSQTEYALPVAASHDLREVYIQGRLGDADDNRWVKVRNWRIQKTAAGTGDELIFPVQYVAGRDVALRYLAPHAQVRDDDDKIHESIYRDRLIFEAALGCLMWRYSKVGDADPRLEGQIVDMRGKVLEARMKYPTKRPRKTGRIFKVGPPGGAPRFKSPDLY